MSNDPVPSDTYDTFGNTISVKDGNGNIITNPNNIGIVNPYRYRSYRYDYESGLYYLNSRYYVPEWGRFLNADDVLMESGSIIGNNLYVYCMNNPINLSDPNGNSAISAFLRTMGKLIKKVMQEIDKIQQQNSLPDYSRVLKGVLMSNAYEVITTREKFGGEVMAYEFYKSVDHGGEWDYKNIEQWKRDIMVPFKLEFIFDGKVITPADFGNIHYGFVGTAAGFSPEILFMGGGYAQAGWKCIFIGPQNYGDYPEDHYAIQQGIDLYNSYFK